MTNSKKQLTDKQKLFLDALFEVDDSLYPSEHKRLCAIAKMAGYAEGTDPYGILKGLSEEVVARTTEFLALHAPKSAKSMVKIQENPTMLGAKNLLDASKEIMDRGGVVKQDKPDSAADTPNSILVVGTKIKVDLDDPNNVIIEDDRND